MAHEKDNFRAIRRSIAKPLPPLKPELPWFFMLSIKFAQHVADLKPFLDTLPKPFHWHLETLEEQATVKEGIFKLNEDGVRKSFDIANSLKAAGNNRAEGLKAYGGAIDALVDVLSMKPDLEDEAKANKAKKLLAVCYGNRAATYIATGPGTSPTKAIEDGKSAEYWDAKYAKAYIRQATAYEQLNDLESAKDAIARGLHLPELENDKGLVDRLIELYTGGKGFPENEDVFKEWLQDVTVSDKNSFTRLDGVKGGWQHKISEHLKKWERS
ncbi:hypothetical protein H0H92_007087 [Tricholoma furcatifolium]|nr:hypothetical protein H0H92_007087 [Tricholoma furcatifolium]